MTLPNSDDDPAVRRGSPDPAEIADRRSPADHRPTPRMKTLGQVRGTVGRPCHISGDPALQGYFGGRTNGFSMIWGSWPKGFIFVAGGPTK